MVNLNVTDRLLPDGIVVRVCSPADLEFVALSDFNVYIFGKL
jgi:hypothetical protein